jgi:hypothetical protein
MIFKDYTIDSKFISFLDNTFYIQKRKDEVLEMTGFEAEIVSNKFRYSINNEIIKIKDERGSLRKSIRNLLTLDKGYLVEMDYGPNGYEWYFFYYANEVQEL